MKEAARALEERDSGMGEGTGSASGRGQRGKRRVGANGEGDGRRLTFSTVRRRLEDESGGGRSNGVGAGGEQVHRERWEPGTPER